MSTGPQLRKRVAQLDWPGLRSLWEQVKARDEIGWGPGKAFEYLVLRAFELDGAMVRWPYEVRVDNQQIEQIDGAVHADGLYCLVESKDTADPVNVTPIGKLRDQLARRPAGTVGLLFSTADFTAPALYLARFSAPHAVLLWTRGELDFLLYRNSPPIRRALLAKYVRCVEEGLPNYDFREEFTRWAPTS